MRDVDDPSYYGELWADVYDEEHGFMDPTPAVGALVDLAAGRRVLELGIGTGRVAIPAAARGVQVEGVDASPSMVRQLREKPGGEHIPVAIGDMATMPLGGPFGLVFVVFNTFFSLRTRDRQLACFRNVAAALEPTGRFVLECFVPDVARFRDGNQTVRAIAADETTLRLNASIHDPVTQIIRTHVLIIRDGQLTDRPVTLRYAWPSELDLMAQLAGLTLEDRWATWTRAALDANSTQHISIYRLA